MMKRITTPLTTEVISTLNCGEQVLLSGIIYTARDSAHKRLTDSIKKGEEIPFNLQGQIIYYVGPTPARPGQVIGSAGPTTSTRMDEYAPLLMEHGLKGMIGKGKRNESVRKSIQAHQAVYFAAVGGAAALISQSIISAKVLAYPELGPEAIYQLEVKDFPVTVVNDVYGRDMYEEGIAKYKI